ncbi:RNA-splicing factor [Toensbergia leucococca]|nr:RNA-splicing factor [Toensbergia leucococca]
MGGDLNLKKSWHPVLMSNQRRVWEEEKKALDERKRIDQMMKERQEERQIQELQDMQEAAGGKKRLNRVDWMYSGPSSGHAGTTEEMEGYLLGKRRVDGIIKGTESKKLEKAAPEDSYMVTQNANTLRDTTSKIREDPMLAIKKKEQAAYTAMMNDPARRRMLIEAAGGDMKPKDKERKHRKHRRHEERDDGYRSQKRRRTDEEDRYNRHSRHHHRRRSDSPSYSRSPSTYRRRSPSRDRRRSPSPYRHRSPSPRYSRRRSPSPYRRSRSPTRERTDYKQLKQSKSWSTPLNHKSPSPGRTSLPTPPTPDDRAAKLAAMQQAASELDHDRDKRIAAMVEREKARQEADDAARVRSAHYGGKGDFVNGLNRKAGEENLGERIRRGRGGLEKERDDY